MRLLTNALNPKAAVTFLALMPQFLPRHPATVQLLLLCGVTLAISVVWMQLVAAVVGSAQKVFDRTVVRRAIDAVTGAVLLAFGLRIAAE